MGVILPRPAAAAGDPEVEAGFKEIGLDVMRRLFTYPDLHRHYRLSLAVVIYIHLHCLLLGIDLCAQAKQAMDAQRLLLVMEKMFLFIYVTMYHFSFFHLHRKRNSIDKLFRIVGRKHFTYKHGWAEEHTDLFEAEKKKFQIFKRAFRNFVSVCGFSTVLIATPLKALAVGSFTTVTNDTKMTFNENRHMGATFPVDESTLGGFIVANIYELVIVVYLLNVVSSTDVLIFSLNNQLKMQLDILVLAVRMLPERAKEMLQEDKGTTDVSLLVHQEYQHRALAENIKHHIIILEFRRGVQKLSNYWLVMLFLGSSLIIGLAGYMCAKNYSTVSGFKNLVSGIIWLIVPFTSIYKYCSSSEEIQTGFKEYEKALYETPWYVYDNKFRKAVRLSLMITQSRDFRLHASSIATFSIQTYGEILKSAFSFINVVNAIEN